MKIGIIGFGNIAPFHASVFLGHKNISLCACVNSEEDYQKAQACGCTEVYTSIKDFYRLGNPDGVVIAVSIMNIKPVLKECISYKKPILVEKPVSIYLKEVTELRNLLRQQRCQVMVGLNRRFYSNIQETRRLILGAGGILGINVDAPDDMYRIQGLNKFPGVVIERWLFANIVHTLDLIRFFGGNVKDIVCFKKNGPDPYSPSFVAAMSLESGALAQYTGHFASIGKWSFDIYCKDMRIKFFDHEHARVFKRNKKEYDLELSEDDRRFKPGFYNQAAYFLQVVEGARKVKFPACTLEDALGTMEMIDYIYNARNSINTKKGR